jgi:hypothetical protein
MGALSCPEGGKMRVLGVGSSKWPPESNYLMKLKKPVISRPCCLQVSGLQNRYSPVRIRMPPPAISGIEQFNPSENLILVVDSLLMVALARKLAGLFL